MAYGLRFRVTCNQGYRGGLVLKFQSVRKKYRKGSLWRHGRSGRDNEAGRLKKRAFDVLGKAKRTGASRASQLRVHRVHDTTNHFEVTRTQALWVRPCLGPIGSCLDLFDPLSQRYTTRSEKLSKLQLSYFTSHAMSSRVTAQETRL